MQSEHNFFPQALQISAFSIGLLLWHSVQINNSHQISPDDPKIITDYLPRGTIADFAIEETIFSMKPGEMSEVIPYLQGTYLIVKLIDKKKMKAKVDYDQYSSVIYNYLLQKKYQDFLTQYVDSLKNHYKITIDLAPLK